MQESESVIEIIFGGTPALWALGTRELKDSELSAGAVLGGGCLQQQ